VGFLYCYLGLDFLTYLLRHTNSETGSDFHYSKQSLLTQTRLAWMLAFRSGFEMSVGYYLIAGIAVALGLSEPQSWPPYFGSFLVSYFLS